MKSLEDRVAYLETQLIAHGISDIDTTAWFSPQEGAINGPAITASDAASAQDSLQDFVGELARGAIQAEPFAHSVTDRSGLSLLTSLLADPVSRTLRNEDASHHTLLQDLPYETRASIPPIEAASKLISTYFEHCDFFSPILSSEADFLLMIKPLYESTNINGSKSLINARFRAFIIFGTAVLLLNRGDSSVPISRSEGYFAAGMHTLSQHSDLILTGDPDHVTNLLLIIQHCCFCANLTAAWHFIGLATRLVVELGLHDERAAIDLSPTERNARRWLFWSTYVLERNLCVIIGRPFSIPDEAIKTPLPAATEGEPRRLLALHQIKVRHFESEIHTTLNYKRPGSLDGAAWRDDMHNRLLQWRASVPSLALEHTSQFAPPAIFDGYFSNSVVHLYYPSPLLPASSNRDLEILAEHAAESIGAYKVAFRTGRLRFYWRTVHNLFRSGMAVVYCIRSASAHPGLDFGPRDMKGLLHSCSSILWGMVERYPPGKAYRDVFDNVVAAALDSSSLATPDPRDQRSILDFISSGFDGGELPASVMSTIPWSFGTPM